VTERKTTVAEKTKVVEKNTVAELVEATVFFIS